MGSALRNFKTLFEDRIIEIAWLGLFLFGIIDVFLPMLVSQSTTPPFLTYINIAIGTFVAVSFLIRNKKTDTFLYLFFFPVLANFLAAAIVRLYMDFDCRGSWIVVFHKTCFADESAEVYRVFDFLSHFLTPITLLHLALNNKDRMKRIFMDPSSSSPLLPLILHNLFPLVVMLCWYTGVRLSGYDPIDLYLIKTATLSDAVRIFLLAPLLLTMPIHYGLMQRAWSNTHWEKYIYTLIFFASLATVLLSFKIYKLSALLFNTMFITSSIILSAIVLTSLKVIHKNHIPLMTSILVMISFFFFLVGEFHFWSVGGSEAIFLATLKSQDFVGIHYILKQLAYVFMVFMVYAAHVFYHISISSDTLFLKEYTLKNLKIILSVGVLLFIIAYFMGMFTVYDIEHTTLDPLWFFFGMLFALEIAFPIRYVLRSFK